MKRLTKKIKEKINEWNETTKQLKLIKSRESNLRDEIVDEVFPDRLEGTTRTELGAGFNLVVTQTYSRELDDSSFGEIFKRLPKGSKKKLIKTKVSLVKAAYDKLTSEERDIFDECITVKPNKPSLKIEEPKGDDE